MKLIAKNAGVNGSVVIEKVCSQLKLHFLIGVKNSTMCCHLGLHLFADNKNCLSMSQDL